MTETMALPEPFNLWANTALIWVGFGTLVGLLAKAIMPGRDPGGAVVTLALGIGGTIIGCGTVTFFDKAHVITPLSPVGFLVSTGGAFVMLSLYRLLAGRFFVEGEMPLRRVRLRGPVRSRAYESTEYIPRDP
jgi:uncharacterized membrane protein YeaQ/YmgE (transglycosylase-associated protein family)